MSGEHFIFRVSQIIRALAESCGMNELDHAPQSILTFIGEMGGGSRWVNASSIIKTKRFGPPPTVYMHIAC